MYVKVTQSGSRRYVQLVEAYRNEAGQPRQRVISTLGRLDQLDSGLDSLINGLLKATGRAPITEGPDASVQFESAKAYGDLWALNSLWHELGFADLLHRLFRGKRHGFDVEQMIRAMVFHRLCCPDSKLGLLRWLPTVSIPAMDVNEITHHRLLRAMDALQDQSEAVQAVTAKLLKPLIDQDLSVVFYDMTTLKVYGTSQLEQDVRAHGKAKSGLIERQCLLGGVQTAEGLPIAHQVWAGNVREAGTLQTALQAVMTHYPIKKMVVVADRGLLSLDNLDMLNQMRIGDQPLQFILAVPGRRYGDFIDILQAHQPQCMAATEEVIGEARWKGHRLLWAHNPESARQKSAERRSAISDLEEQAQAAADKLDAQDEGKRQRGRKLSDNGAAARLYHQTLEAKLGHILEVHLNSDTLTWSINERNLARTELMDGKLLLVSNVTDLSPQAIIDRYKGLSDIERGFRVLKSDLEIAPMFHRLSDRIHAHATICFFALILHRVIRLRLKQAASPYSPDRALQMLRVIQRHKIHLNGARTVTGMSTIDQQQAQIYAAIRVTKPTAQQ